MPSSIETRGRGALRPERSRLHRLVAALAMLAAAVADRGEIGRACVEVTSQLWAPSRHIAVQAQRGGVLRVRQMWRQGKVWRCVPLCAGRSSLPRAVLYASRTQESATRISAALTRISAALTPMSCPFDPRKGADCPVHEYVQGERQDAHRAIGARMRPMRALVVLAAGLPVLAHLATAAPPHDAADDERECRQHQADGERHDDV